MVGLDRIRANIEVLRARVAPAQFMLVVKNDAYGHGVERVVAAAAAGGVEWFGAFDVRMGLRARAAAPDARVFAWVTVGQDEIAQALDARIELGVGDAGYLEHIAAVSAGRAVHVHLKIDTGLHRNGVRPEDWPSFVARAAALEAAGEIRVVGVWSHIAETSDETDDAARALYLDAVRIAHDAGLRPAALHLAASAAGYARAEFRHDLVRFGAFSYGIRSTGGTDLEGLVPAATLLAPVTAVSGSKDTGSTGSGSGSTGSACSGSTGSAGSGSTGSGSTGSAGSGSSDSGSTDPDWESRSVEVGYGSLDGLPSTLAGRVTVGTPAGPRPLLAVGETSLTVGAWPGAAVGDEVAVFGPGRWGESSVTTLAEAIGTVGEEIIVRVSPLVPREYVSLG